MIELKIDKLAFSHRHLFKQIPSFYLFSKKLVFCCFFFHFVVVFFSFQDSSDYSMNKDALFHYFGMPLSELCDQTSKLMSPRGFINVPLWLAGIYQTVCNNINNMYIIIRLSKFNCSFILL